MKNFVTIVWIMIAFFGVIGLFKIANELHFLGVETRRVAWAVRPYYNLFDNEYNNIFVIEKNHADALEKIGKSENEIAAQLKTYK